MHFLFQHKMTKDFDPKYMRTKIPNPSTRTAQEARKRVIDASSKTETLVYNTVMDLLYSNNNMTSWIGGSRSWEHWKNRNDINVRPEDEMAFHTANFDIFTMVNDIDVAKKLICSYFTRLVKLFKDLYITEKGNESIYFMGKYKAAIQYSDTLSLPVENLQKILFDKENTWNFNNCREHEIADPSTMNSLPSFTGYEIWLNLNDKQNFIYCTILYCPGVNLTDFAETYISPPNSENDLTYLNENGLYLTYNMMSKIERNERSIDKGLAVDNIRVKYLRPNVKNNAPLLYDHLFKGTYSSNNFYKSWTLFDMWKDTLPKESFDSVTTYFKDVERWATAIFRSSLNSILVLINMYLNTHVPNAYAFILGGDAMRRYVYTISPSNDIDLKIYCPDEQAVDYVQWLVKYVISVSVEYFNIHIRDLIPTSTLHGVEGLELSTIVPGKSQFRPRYIKAIGSRLLHLHSIDYRYFTSFVYRGYPLESYMSLAILDITIEVNPSPGYIQSINKPIDIVSIDNTAVLNENILKDHTIDVASLEWLTSDLSSYYSNKELARKREELGKRSKDIVRYKKLRDYDGTPISQEEKGCINTANWGLMNFVLNPDGMLTEAIVDKHAYSTFNIWAKLIYKSAQLQDVTDQKIRGRLSFKPLISTSDQSLRKEWGEFKLNFLRIGKKGDIGNIQYSLSTVNTYQHVLSCLQGDISDTRLFS